MSYLDTVKRCGVLKKVRFASDVFNGAQVNKTLGQLLSCSPPIQLYMLRKPIYQISPYKIIDTFDTI